MNKIRYYAFVSAMLALVPLLAAGLVKAQGALSVSRVSIAPAAPGENISKTLFIVFSRDIADKKAKPTDAESELSALLKPEAYVVLRRKVGEASPPEVINVLEVRPHCCYKDYLYLRTDKELEKDFETAAGDFKAYQYIVIVDDRTTFALKSPSTLTINELFPAGSENNPVDISREASYDIRPSKDRDESNVYVAGTLTGATDSKPSYSADVKISIPFVARRPETKAFFDLKANSNPKADPDSMNFGIEYSGFGLLPEELLNGIFGEAENSNLRGGNNCVQKADECRDLTKQRDEWITRVDYSFYGKIETNREFENTNVIGGANVTLPFRKGTRSRRFEFNLFSGMDIGRNMLSPLPEAEGRAIFRPYAGFSTFVGLFRKKDFFPVSVEANYTHRWFLTREVKLDKNDAGEVISIFFSKKPRLYLDTKLNFQFNPYFGIFAGYEYGEKPPDYKLIKNSFKFGFVYKFKFKGKDEK